MRGSCETAGNGYGALAGGSVGSSPRAPCTLVDALGLGVVRLHLVVADRPRGRDAVAVAQLAEVLGAQPVQRGAVELRRAADEVVDLRLERLAVAVVPGVRATRSGCRRTPRCASQFCGSRGSQSPRSSSRIRLPDGREAADERAAAGAAADHDHVVVAVLMCGSSSSSATMMRAAASISARCENACGKLPRCRPVSASNSSA